MPQTRRSGVRFDALSNHVIGAAIEVHRHLGPGLLESAYELCLAEELRLRGISSERQVALPAVYRGKVLNFGYRIDFVIGNIAVEIKAVDSILPVHRAQLLTCLRLKKLPIGLLLNFEVAALREGIVRIVNEI
ncbi:MAG TPA: GxxExxY protein [Gemmatimonadales bacterium]|nr:GxxExxY protein [Gemmatimonadales bacterium]